MQVNFIRGWQLCLKFGRYPSRSSQISSCLVKQWNWQVHFGKHLPLWSVDKTVSFLPWWQTLTTYLYPPRAARGLRLIPYCCMVLPPLHYITAIQQTLLSTATYPTVYTASIYKEGHFTEIKYLKILYWNGTDRVFSLTSSVLLNLQPLAFAYRYPV